MKKTYVLDTNVLLSDPNALFVFKDNDVVLPLIVIEELDRHKDRADEVGRNARETARTLSDLTKSHKDLKAGVPINEEGGMLYVMSVDDIKKKDYSIPVELDSKSGDNIIIGFCKGLQNIKENLVLLTRDTLLRIKGEALGITCEDYKKFNVSQSKETLYSGVKNLSGDYNIDDFYKDKELNLKDIEEKPYPNQFLIAGAEGGSSALMRYHPDGVARAITDFSPSKISARNKEQRFAIDLLLDPKVQLVSLAGMAGTGKSLIAIACGLHQVLNSKKYRSLVVCRPVQPVGKDIGFLPGPQPLDAKILTPTGWTTMGQVKIGSEIIGRDGKSTKVLGVYPKGIKHVYRITTTDGTSTECCDDHLWYTETFENKKRKKSGSVKSTKEIMLSLRDNTYNKLNHYLPRNEAVEYKSTTLPVPPYVLGVLLGDGHISNSISFANMDQELIFRVENEVKKFNIYFGSKKYGISHNLRTNNVNNKPAKPIRLTNIYTKEIRNFSRIGEAVSVLGISRGMLNDRCANKRTINDWKYEFLPCLVRWTNPIKNQLYILGLEGKRAWNKFIPDMYKYQSSVEDRIALLQGLMDTDGTIKKNGEASYCTTSMQLAKDLIEIVRSLGGRATFPSPRNRVGKKSMINKRTVTSRRVSYEFTISLPFNINPFYISRKASRHQCSYIHGVAISSIEPIGTKEVQCIKVENSEQLYLTDDFIVTHNTIEEKLAPWMEPIKDNLRFLLSENGKKSKRGEETLQMLFENGTIEVQAMTYIRGRSIANAYMLIDEAQNLSVLELKTILTRAGEGTKIVLTGDLDQIDSLYVDSVSNGLAVCIEKFKGQDLFGHVTLVSGERSELASLSSKLL